MNATSEATDTPVSSFASFGEEARQDPPGDARRSERAPDSFEACDALVDELIEDDRGRHFGALARLREDRQRRATTNVEETTGRGFYATARLRLSDPAVRDARELRDASLSCEPFEDASARVTLAERARARPANDDVGLIAPRASLRHASRGARRRASGLCDERTAARPQHEMHLVARTGGKRMKCRLQSLLSKLGTDRFENSGDLLFKLKSTT